MFHCLHLEVFIDLITWLSEICLTSLIALFWNFRWWFVISRCCFLIRKTFECQLWNVLKKPFCCSKNLITLYLKTWQVAFSYSEEDLKNSQRLLRIKTLKKVPVTGLRFIYNGLMNGRSIQTWRRQMLSHLIKFYQFYWEIRKQDGKEYEPDSLRVMQNSLYRYFSEIGYSKRPNIQRKS